MIISVASGKGGTGKTTIAASLAYYIAGSGEEVNIFDCDVEEPNVNLFLKSDIKVCETVYIPIPEVYEEKCNGCGKCEKICEFNAIVMVKEKPLVFPDLCHACGGCKMVCPTAAITERNKEVGTIEEGYLKSIRYVGGKLRISEAISPPLIEAVKKHIIKHELNIIDCPPGTSCPSIASIKSSNYIILVAEPTPFGLHDLKLIIEVVKHIGIPFGVLINKSGLGDDGVTEYCRDKEIEILASIPHSRELAVKYSQGSFPEYFSEQYGDLLKGLIDKVAVKTGRGAQ